MYVFYGNRCIKCTCACDGVLTDAREREAKVRESVERAKEAVALDVKDGTSWSKLGS